MTDHMTLPGLKAQAKRLRADLAGQGTQASHSDALEMVAHLHGARDWNTLSAEVRAHTTVLSLGARVSGRYLGHPFQGRVLALASLPRGRHRVTVAFDAPIDVVASDSFQSLRRRVTAVVNEKGVSAEKISDGTPHMELSL